MTHTATQISAERLNQRIDVDNPDDELGALAQTLNQMIERLERSFTEMQRFTADAAHELRTPLAVIRNEAEVALRSTRTTEEYSRVLENLLEETNRLSSLADQLLFLCRQDAGLQLPKREKVAMDSLLKEVVANMALVAEAKGIDLSLEGECGCDIAADGGQLRRVFYNLLDNAIKYTEPGGKVTVATRTVNGCITVEVRDTGIGIPQEQLPRIFDRFYRVDPARAGENNGTGLGLSICQSVVRAIGGTITATSTEGRGSVFEVRLKKATKH
jgi:heavy metal sensor kinase